MRLPRVLVLLLVVLVAAPAMAQQVNQDEAAARYDRGVKLFGEGDYAGALAEFDTVYKLTQRWEVLFNVAVCQKKLFRYGKAVRSLERYLAEGGTKVDAARKQAVEAELSEIRALVAEISVVVEGAPAEIEVDGLAEGTTPLDRPLLLGSGRHVIRASRAGEKADEKAIDVVSGQNATVKLAPAPFPVEVKTAKITIDSSPPGGEVVVDGKRLGPAPWTGELGAGGHQLSVTLPGHSRGVQELVVVPGQERRIMVELLALAPEETPYYRTWWFWGGVGAVVVGAAVTAIVIASQPEEPDVVIHFPE